MPNTSTAIHLKDGDTFRSGFIRTTECGPSYVVTRVGTTRSELTLFWEPDITMLDQAIDDLIQVRNQVKAHNLKGARA